jgi:hypothetical protein
MYNLQTIGQKGKVRHEAITRHSKHIYVRICTRGMMKQDHRSYLWSGWVVQRYPKVGIQVLEVRSFQNKLRRSEIGPKFPKWASEVLNRSEASKMGFGGPK